MTTTPPALILSIQNAITHAAAPELATVKQALMTALEQATIAANSMLSENYERNQRAEAVRQLTAQHNEAKKASAEADATLAAKHKIEESIRKELAAHSSARMQARKDAGVPIVVTKEQRDLADAVVVQYNSDHAAELDDLEKRFEAALAETKAAQQVYWNARETERKIAEWLSDAQRAVTVNDTAVGGTANLKDVLFEVAGLTRDQRFTHYAKRVTGIDEGGKGGYMFVGDFVGNGTVLVPQEAALYMVSSTTGSMRHNSADIRLIIKHANGALELLPYSENDLVQGWALRLLPYVKQSLERVASLSV